MRILRIIVGIVAGYVVYAFGSMFLVGIVMNREGLLIMVLCLGALVLLGGGAGYVISVVAGSEGRIAGMVTAGLVAAATLANLQMQLGAEPSWYKVGTLVLTVPCILWISRIL